MTSVQKKSSHRETKQQAEFHGSMWFCWLSNEVHGHCVDFGFKWKILLKHSLELIISNKTQSLLQLHSSETWLNHFFSPVALNNDHYVKCKLKPDISSTEITRIICVRCLQFYWIQFHLNLFFDTMNERKKRNKCCMHDFIHSM